MNGSLWPVTLWRQTVTAAGAPLLQKQAFQILTMILYTLWRICFFDYEYSEYLTQEHLQQCLRRSLLTPFMTKFKL